LAIGNYQLQIERDSVTDRAGNALGSGILTSTFVVQSNVESVIGFESGFDSRFTFEGISVVGSVQPGSGYDNVRSFTNSNIVAFNPGATSPSTFTWVGNGETFDLVSFVIAGAWGTQTLTVQGLLNGAVAFSSPLFVSPTPVVFSPSWVGIDQLRIHIGNDFVDFRLGGSGRHWALDNLVIRAEPGDEEPVLQRLQPPVLASISSTGLHQAPVVLGDFNGDSLVNALDIDLLARAAHNEPTNQFYDLNGDDRVTFSMSSTGAIVSDSDVLIRTILRTQYGDSNLDGTVYLGDLIAFGTHFRQAGQFGWAQGNFNGSQELGTTASPQVFLADLNALATHWRFGIGTSSASSAALPDPSSDTPVPHETAAAHAAAILSDAPTGRQGSRSLAPRVFNPSRRAEFGENDLLLLALDRAARLQREHVSLANDDIWNDHDRQQDPDRPSPTDELVAAAFTQWP
jgi:hypothetical protein